MHVLESTPDHVIGRVPGAAIHIWRGATKPAAVPLVSRAVDEASRDGSGLPVVLIGVVEADALFPDDDARKALSEGMRDAAKLIGASAMVFEGHGFKFSALRAIVAGLGLLARTSYPTDVFATPSAAAAWAVRTCPGHDAQALARGVEALRATPPRA